MLFPLVRHWRTTAAIGRFTAGARHHEIWGGAQVSDSAIHFTRVRGRQSEDRTFSTRHEQIKIPFERVSRIDVVLVEGDAGFSDGNTEYHLVVIHEKHDVTHAFWLTDCGERGDYANFTRGLAGTGFLKIHAPIEGQLRGIGFLVAYLWTILVVSLVVVLAWRLWATVRPYP
jgi:hypothetical protein